MSSQDSNAWFLLIVTCTNTVVSFVFTGVHFTLNLTAKYQRIWGFGGAFTDAAGINIDSLSLKAKENLMR